MSKIYTIPDIHGRSDLLDQALLLLDKDGYDAKKDLLIFLGDMIDRGPDSKGVIDIIQSLIKNDPDTVIALRGNHENFAIDAIVRGRGEDLWYCNGGYDTEDSYPNGKMTQEHAKWLALLPLSYSTDKFFFSHAPVPKFNELSVPGYYSEHNLTWTYNSNDAYFTEREEGGPLGRVGICGHIHKGPNTRVENRTGPSYRMLDCGAGCYEEAWLAIHECTENRTFYSKPEDLADEDNLYV